MKKLIIALFITGTFFTACTTEDTTANVSSITYFPVFTILGPNPYFTPQGSPYEDPGAVAKAGTTVIPHTTAAVGKYRGTTTLDTNKMDEYAVSYSAKNSDGFVGTGSRRVIVWKNGDLTTSIEGMYTSTVKRNGSFMSPTQGSSLNMKFVYIWKNANGTYQVSDAFGGWYNLGRNIAASFTPAGIFDATFVPTGNSLTNPYFGGTAVIKSLSVNVATKTIVMTTHWDAPNGALPPTPYDFECTLVQTNP